MYQNDVNQPLYETFVMTAHRNQKRVKFPDSGQKYDLLLGKLNSS